MKFTLIWLWACLTGLLAFENANKRSRWHHIINMVMIYIWMYMGVFFPILSKNRNLSSFGFLSIVVNKFL